MTRGGTLEKRNPRGIRAVFQNLLREGRKEKGWARALSISRFDNERRGEGGNTQKTSNFFNGGRHLRGEKGLLLSYEGERGEGKEETQGLEKGTCQVLTAQSS